MPPVSLPLIGGTQGNQSVPLNQGGQSARAGAHASIPHTATRLAALIIRIADSISAGGHLKAHLWSWKERLAVRRGVIARCCRVALDLVRASRHAPRVGSSGGLPMRDLFTSLK